MASDPQLRPSYRASPGDPPGWGVDLKFENVINGPEDKPIISRQKLINIFPSTNSNDWAPQANGTKVAEENCEKLISLLFSSGHIPEAESQTNNELVTSTANRLVEQRIGQDRLRNELLAQVQCCEISGVSNPALLRVSHIKPWSVDPENRGNLNNVLLLAAPYDFLFDQGFISFDKDGWILISPKLSSKDRGVFSLRSSLKLSSERSLAVAPFMDWHRKNLFQKL